MRILFIHKNFPAQFGGLGTWLAQEGWDVTFATEREDIKTQAMRVVRYTPHRAPNKETHRYLLGTEAAVIAAQSMARTAIAMKNKGYSPDIVVAHSGWGSGSFVKDVWPDAIFIPYFEWFYKFPPADTTPHDKSEADPIDDSARNRVRNLPFHLDLASADHALCPTTYQADQFPGYLRDRLTVLHDGIDTSLHAPAPRNPDLLKELGIPEGARIMTWVTRGMEPARGFPEMMAALSALQKMHPDLHAIIVGEDRIAYGSKTKVKSWKDKMLAEFELDRTRLHFTGLVSRSRLVEILNAGDLHLYLTAPFVLSWSLLDAMSTGATLVVSDVAPVREFIIHEREGVLVDTYDHDALVAQISEVLTAPEAFAHLGTAARARIAENYDAHRIIYPKKKALFERWVNARGSA